MVNGAITMTIAKRALIVRADWDATVRHPRPKLHGDHLTAEDVLKFVEKGRQEHRVGKTRLIHSLSELRS